MTNADCALKRRLHAASPVVPTPSRLPRGTPRPTLKRQHWRQTRDEEEEEEEERALGEAEDDEEEEEEAVEEELDVASTTAYVRVAPSSRHARYSRHYVRSRIHIQRLAHCRRLQRPSKPVTSHSHSHSHSDSIDHRAVGHTTPLTAVETDGMRRGEAAASLVVTLPLDVLQLVLAQLDGPSLLCCASTCRVLARLSHDRAVWKRICMAEWPTLRTQVLPQLPGAPDYDLIRLYGGSWRRCFQERHQRTQRAELCVRIPQFSKRGTDKLVSETFSIGVHRFCLWIFPRGNPNEPQYAGHVLSVYLVLTDLDRREPNWQSCAVFSLRVENARETARSIVWDSCLADNNFHARLNNWGVHSLGRLEVLQDPRQGFVVNDTLTVTARVRLMSITFRVVREQDLRGHHQLGLAVLAQADSLILPFCATLQDLLTALAARYHVDPARVRVWCFNQPVVSGQALRPRKLLTREATGRGLATSHSQSTTSHHAAGVHASKPLFGNLLCDGVDIDAYSLCHLYLEDDDGDLPLLNAVHPPADCMGTVRTMDEGDHHIAASTVPPLGIQADGDEIMAPPPPSIEEMTVGAFPEAEPTTAHTMQNFVFVKVMDPETHQLRYLGRMGFASGASLDADVIRHHVGQHLGCSPGTGALLHPQAGFASELMIFKEEIAPIMYSGPLPASSLQQSIPLAPATTATTKEYGLQHADIVIVALRATVASGSFHRAMLALLHSHYRDAEALLAPTPLDDSPLARYLPAPPPPTLAAIEALAERLDIPKFRVRSAFRKCHEDGRATLRYIMEGRHLGFICDSCGETDFKGQRFNCVVCSDYDLCHNCHVRSHEVNHRYANVDGKWQRVYDFKDHNTTHAMREMRPVFYQYQTADAA